MIAQRAVNLSLSCISLDPCSKLADRAFHRTLLQMSHTQFKLELAKEGQYYYWFMYLQSLRVDLGFRHSWIQELKECPWAQLPSSPTHQPPFPHPESGDHKRWGGLAEMTHVKSLA